MTREEFLRDINSWYDLKVVDNESELYMFNDVYDDAGRDERINEEISEFYGNWDDLRDYLDEIRDDDYYHRQIDSFEWVEVDDEFDDAKARMFDALENDGFFEDDEVDENDEDDEDDTCSPVNTEKTARGYLYKKDEVKDDFGTEQVDFGMLVG